MKEVLFTVQLENCLRDYCDLTGFAQPASSQDPDSARRLQSQLLVFLFFHSIHLGWVGFATTLRQTVQVNCTCACVKSECPTCRTGGFVPFSPGVLGQSGLGPTRRSLDSGLPLPPTDRRLCVHFLSYKVKAVGSPDFLLILKFCNSKFNFYRFIQNCCFKNICLM